MQLGALAFSIANCCDVWLNCSAFTASACDSQSAFGFSAPPAGQRDRWRQFAGAIAGTSICDLSADRRLTNIEKLFKLFHFHIIIFFHTLLPRICSVGNLRTLVDTQKPHSRHSTMIIGSHSHKSQLLSPISVPSLQRRRRAIRTTTTNTRQ